MLRSDDPLPQNVIRFSDAFEQFFQAIEPNWRDLETRVNDSFGAMERDGFTETLQNDWSAAVDALEDARFAAWRQWRANLQSGRFVACIRDPAHDVILELDKKGWAGPVGLGPHCLLDDFVCPNDPILAEAARPRTDWTSMVEAALFMLATTGMIADPENMSDWDEPNWRDAAIEYHRDRPRGPAIESERLARLMADGVSLDCAWHELRDNRPTPKTTTDAIIVTVRECGLQALQEPVNQVRLRRCDPEARASFDHWLSDFRKGNCG